VGENTKHQFPGHFFDEPAQSKEGAVIRGTIEIKRASMLRMLKKTSCFKAHCVSRVSSSPRCVCACVCFHTCSLSIFARTYVLSFLYSTSILTPQNSTPRATLICTFSGLNTTLLYHATPRISPKRERERESRMAFQRSTSFPSHFFDVNPACQRSGAVIC